MISLLLLYTAKGFVLSSDVACEGLDQKALTVSRVSLSSNSERAESQKLRRVLVKAGATSLFATDQMIVRVIPSGIEIRDFKTLKVRKLIPEPPGETYNWTGSVQLYRDGLRALIQSHSKAVVYNFRENSVRRVAGNQKTSGGYVTLSERWLPGDYNRGGSYCTLSSGNDTTVRRRAYPVEELIPHLARSFR